MKENISNQDGIDKPVEQVVQIETPPKPPESLPIQEEKQSLQVVGSPKQIMNHQSKLK